MKVDRWWCSGLSLIILSEIMEKKQQQSLRGILLQTYHRDRLLIFSRLVQEGFPHNSKNVYKVTFNPEIATHLSKKKHKAFLLPDLRDEPYSLPLVNEHSITQAGNSSGVQNGWREPDKIEIKLVTDWFSTSLNSASLYGSLPYPSVSRHPPPSSTWKQDLHIAGKLGNKECRSN